MGRIFASFKVVAGGMGSKLSRGSRHHDKKGVGPIPTRVNEHNNRMMDAPNRFGSVRRDVNQPLQSFLTFFPASGKQPCPLKY
jgi:hypothetical protein